MPSDWVKEGPNEAGLAAEYVLVRDTAAPILRKEYLNPGARLVDLRERLPFIPRELISRFAESRPKDFALKILAALHGGLSPAYLRNLIKRGSLFGKISFCWSQAPTELPLTGLHHSLPIKG